MLLHFSSPSSFSYDSEQSLFSLTTKSGVTLFIFTWSTLDYRLMLLHFPSIPPSPPFSEWSAVIKLLWKKERKKRQGRAIGGVQTVQHFMDTNIYTNTNTQTQIHKCANTKSDMVVGIGIVQDELEGDLFQQFQNRKELAHPLLTGTSVYFFFTRKQDQKVSLELAAPFHLFHITRDELHVPENSWRCS